MQPLRGSWAAGADSRGGGQQMGNPRFRGIIFLGCLFLEGTWLFGRQAQWLFFYELICSDTSEAGFVKSSTTRYDWRLDERKKTLAEWQEFFGFCVRVARPETALPLDAVVVPLRFRYCFALAGRSHMTGRVIIDTLPIVVLVFTYTFLSLLMSD